MVDLVVRTPLAIFFFLVLVGLARPSLVKMDSSLIQQSALCFFSALGPLAWLERSLMLLPDASGGDGLTPLGDILSEERKQRLRLFVWFWQVVLIVGGVAFASRWL